MWCTRRHASRVEARLYFLRLDVTRMPCPLAECISHGCFPRLGKVWADSNAARSQWQLETVLRAAASTPPTRRRQTGRLPCSGTALHSGAVYWRCVVSLYRAVRWCCAVCGVVCHRDGSAILPPRAASGCSCNALLAKRDTFTPFKASSSQPNAKGSPHRTLHRFGTLLTMQLNNGESLIEREGHWTRGARSI
jgi:hypothetical protein